jgi:hypothetical protein
MMNKINSHQLNALIMERPFVKVATSQNCSVLVLGKSGSIVGDPPFINNMLGAVNFALLSNGEKKHGE